MVNGCSIDTREGLHEWHIDQKTIQKLYPLLYKDTETGGKFIMHGDGTKVLVDYKTTEGNADSVQAPNAIVNFHTHPISCYNSEENTVWGSMSAEDIRETILFSLKGSVAHMVLSVEGVYTLQVNPCILQNFIEMEDIVNNELIKIHKNKKDLGVFKHVIDIIIAEKFVDPSEIGKFFNDYNKNLLKKDLHDYIKNGVIGRCLSEISCDIFRGIIILMIEIYFRATHRFRSYDINEHNYIYPSDIVKFVNSFKISNIFNIGKKIKGCGNLECGGVPVIEENKHSFKFKSTSFKTYLGDYEKTTGFYLVNKHGETLSIQTTLYKLLDLCPYVKDIIKKNKPHCTNLHSSPKLKWDTNWFNMTLAHNDVIINGKQISYVSDKLNGKIRKEFLKSKHPKIFIKETPTFYYFSINGKCDHKNTNNHLRNSPNVNFGYTPNVNFGYTPNVNFGLVVYTATSCNWCKKLLELLNNKNIKYKQITFDSVSEAISEARKINPDITTVPAVFYENGDTASTGDYIGGYEEISNLLK